MAKSRASESRTPSPARALCRAQPKLSKTDFEDAAANVRKNLPDYLPKMIAYKSSIQQLVLLAATPEEKEDIINSKPNTSLIEISCKREQSQARLSYAERSRDYSKVSRTCP